MSRTYKDRGKRRRLVKSSLYKKYLHIYGDDFTHKRKYREINRSLRIKLKNELKKEQLYEQ